MVRNQKFLTKGPESLETKDNNPTTSFPGFSPTRPYGASETETLVGSGHVVPEQN